MNTTIRNTPDLRILGIAGAANSGKTTIIRKIIQAAPRSMTIGYLHMGSYIKKCIFDEIRDIDRSIVNKPYVFRDNDMASFLASNGVIFLPGDIVSILKEFYSLPSRGVSRLPFFHGCQGRNIGHLIQHKVTRLKSECDDFFIRDTEKRILKMIDKVPDLDLIIVDGVRYSADAMWIRGQEKGRVMMIQGEAFMVDGRDPSHSSENLTNIPYDFAYLNRSDMAVYRNGNEVMSTQDLVPVFNF